MKIILANQEPVFFIKDDKTIKKWIIVGTSHTVINSTEITDEQLKYLIETEINIEDLGITDDQLLESPTTPQLQVNIVSDEYVFSIKEGADAKLLEIEAIIAKNLKASNINTINQYLEAIITLVDNELNDDYVTSLKELIIDDENILQF